MAKKVDRKTTEGKWYRIQRDDDIAFSLYEREGDEVRLVTSDILAIVQNLADQLIQKEAGLC